MTYLVLILGFKGHICFLGREEEKMFQEEGINHIKAYGVKVYGWHGS